MMCDTHDVIMVVSEYFSTDNDTPHPLTLAQPKYDAPQISIASTQWLFER